MTAAVPTRYVPNATAALNAFAEALKDAAPPSEENLFAWERKSSVPPPSQDENVRVPISGAWELTHE